MYSSTPRRKTSALNITAFKAWKQWAIRSGIHPKVLGFFDAAIIEPVPFETVDEFLAIRPAGGCVPFLVHSCGYNDLEG